MLQTKASWLTTTLLLGRNVLAKVAASLMTVTRSDTRCSNGSFGWMGSLPPDIQRRLLPGFFCEASSASEQPCDIGVVSRRVSVYRHIGMKNFFVQPALCMGLCIFSVSCCIDAAQQRRQPTAGSRSTRPARQTYFCDSGPVCAWTSEPL